MYGYVSAFLRRSHDTATACGVYESLEVLAVSLMKTTGTADWPRLKAALPCEQATAIAGQLWNTAHALETAGDAPHDCTAHRLLAIDMYASTTSDPVAVSVEQFLDQLIATRIGAFTSTEAH